MKGFFCEHGKYFEILNFFVWFRVCLFMIESKKKRKCDLWDLIEFSNFISFLAQQNDSFLY